MSDVKRQISAGYTLIELLITLSIIGLIFAFGYASFRDYSRRQAFAGVARDLRGDLRLGQELALSGNKPSDPHCAAPNLLSGYNFNVTSPTSYALEAVCSGATGGVVEVKSVDLTSAGVTIAPSQNPILFKTLGEGTDIPQGGQADIVLTQLVTNSTQTVAVHAGGDIE